MNAKLLSLIGGGVLVAVSAVSLLAKPCKDAEECNNDNSVSGKTPTAPDESKDDEIKVLENDD